jgi:hypothetical protein
MVSVATQRTQQALKAKQQFDGACQMKEKKRTYFVQVTMPEERTIGQVCKS